MHDELRAHHAVRLGVAAALVFARAVMLAHVGAERLDDGVGGRLFVGQHALLGELEALVVAAQVHDPLRERRDRLAQEQVDELPQAETLEAPQRGAARGT